MVRVSMLVAVPALVLLSISVLTTPKLPESGVTDEEVHAIAALLRGNSTIAELNLRGNEVQNIHTTGWSMVERNEEAGGRGWELLAEKVGSWRNSGQ